VGGVSGRPTRSMAVLERSTPSVPPAFAMVEGVPVCWMAWSFAGSRRNAGLRSVRRLATGLLPCQRPYRRHRTSRDRRGRERCPHARIATHAPDARCSNHLAPRPMTRPSLGPRTRADQSPLVNSFGATRRRWRARVGIAVGKTWRKSGGTGTGTFASGSCAARRVSPLPQGRLREASEKEGRHGARPSEDQESSRFVPARRMQLQKSTGDAWSRRSSSYALQKERQGRVNGDLDRRGPRRSHVVGMRRFETASRHSGALRTSRSEIGRRPRVT
jgi:hypothetical protein